MDRQNAQPAAGESGLAGFSEAPRGGKQSEVGPRTMSDEQVIRLLDEHPRLSWDAALAEILGAAQ